MTWQELTENEPALLDLKRELQAITDEGGAAFCANAVWYGFGAYKGNGFKARLLALVEYGAGYDDAARHLYEQLPACRNCLCA